VTLCTCDGWGWGASLTDSVGALRPAACCGACTSPRLLWCCTGMGMHCILAQPHELDPRTSSMQLWACAARLYRALGLGLCKGSCRPGWAGLCLSSSADLEQCHGCCYCLGCTCIGAPACAQPRSAPLLQTNLSARQLRCCGAWGSAYVAVQEWRSLPPCRRCGKLWPCSDV